VLQYQCCNISAAISVLQYQCCNISAAISVLQYQCCNISAAISVLQHQCCNITNCVVPFPLSKGFFVGAASLVLQQKWCYNNNFS